MADIEVILKEGGVIEVVNEFQPVLESEFVHWHFRALDGSVAKVKIEFEEAPYFRVGGTPTRAFSRHLEDADTIYGRPPAARSYPSIGEGRVVGLRDKYSITTFDADDVEIASIDPEIVPIRPGPA